MDPAARPLLFLDVDGVLALSVGSGAPDGFVPYTVTASTGQEHRVWLNPRHGTWLNELGEHFEIVWATGWENDAPRLLGPLLGLAPMRAIVFTERPRVGVRLRKLPDVADFAGDASAAWVDDDLDAEMVRWADQRNAPTLLVEPDSAHGLTRDHVRQLIRFSEDVAGTGDRSDPT